MRSLNIIQTLSKVGRVFSKIVFILSVVGFCCCTVLIGLGSSGKSILKIGRLSLHGLLPDGLVDNGFDIYSIISVLSAWAIYFVGEAVLAKFAEIYFKNELNAGSPFTLEGAKELLRLGILTVAIPIGCASIGELVCEIISGLVKTTSAAKMAPDSVTSIALGVMFIIGSLICRYGAEIRNNARAEETCGINKTAEIRKTDGEAACD